MNAGPSLNKTGSNIGAPVLLNEKLGSVETRENNSLFRTRLTRY
jgi:hypothetical protein